MKDNSMYTLDMIFVYVFGILAVVAYIGVLFGAWWHSLTMVFCLAISKVSWNDAIREKAEMEKQSDQDDHNPHTEE